MEAQRAEALRHAPLEFIRLMGALTPPGRLCVRLHGAPRSDRDLRLRGEIVRAAARCRAHVREGVSILDVSFSRGASACVGPHASIYLDTRTQEDMQRRAYILASMIVLAVLVGASQMR